MTMVIKTVLVKLIIEFNSSFAILSWIESNMTINTIVENVVIWLWSLINVAFLFVISWFCGSTPNVVLLFYLFLLVRKRSSPKTTLETRFYSSWNCKLLIKHYSTIKRKSQILTIIKTFHIITQSHVTKSKQKHKR